MDKFTEKKSFLLYKDFWEPIRELTNEQLGRLFRAIYEFQAEGIIDEVDPDIRMVWKFFMKQFKIDDEKYEQICQKNRENQQKRWKQERDTVV